MESSMSLEQRAGLVEGLQAFLDDVDGKLKALSQKAETTAGEAQVKAHLGLMEAQQLWDGLKTELGGMLAKARALKEDGEIELYFGKEDAKAALLKLREKAEETEISLAGVSNLASDVTSDLGSALQRLADAYASVKGKLLH